MLCPRRRRSPLRDPAPSRRPRLRRGAGYPLAVASSRPASERRASTTRRSKVSNAGVAIALSVSPSGSPASSWSRASRAVCNIPRAVVTVAATSSVMALLLREARYARQRFAAAPRHRPPGPGGSKARPPAGRRNGGRQRGGLNGSRFVRIHTKAQVIAPKTATTSSLFSSHSTTLPCRDIVSSLLPRPDTRRLPGCRSFD